VSWTRGIASCDVIDTDRRLSRFVLELEMLVGEMYHDFINNNIDSRFIVPRFTVPRINDGKGENYRTGTCKLIADCGLAPKAACSPFSLETPYGLSGLHQLILRKKCTLFYCKDNKVDSSHQTHNLQSNAEIEQLVPVEI